MPRGTWTQKDERQYKAVLKSCLKKDGRKTKSCKSMAAAVVNKRRSSEGRTKKLNWFQKALVDSGWKRVGKNTWIKTSGLPKRPPFNPKKMGLRAASKKECLYRRGNVFQGVRTKRGCVWGWGKFHGKLFKKKG